MIKNKYHSDLRFLALVGIIICLFLASSCITNRKGELTEKGKNFIAEHCHGSDSVAEKHEIIYKDTTIYLPGKDGETIFIPSPCDSAKKGVDIVKHKNGIKTEVKSTGGALEFSCEADSLKAVIKILQDRITITSKEKTVIEKPCDKEHVTGTMWYFIRSGQIAIVFIVFEILIKILITFWPVTKPFLGWAYIFKI